MKNNKGLERMNVDVLGQEKQAITAFDEKDGLYRQRIKPTISFLKRGFKKIVLLLALGACMDMLFVPSRFCLNWDYNYAVQSKPITNIIDSHDDSWLELEESPMFWSYPCNYPSIESSPPEPESQIKINPPLNWQLL